MGLTKIWISIWDAIRVFFPHLPTYSFLPLNNYSYCLFNVFLTKFNLVNTAHEIFMILPLHFSYNCIFYCFSTFHPASILCAGQSCLSPNTWHLSPFSGECAFYLPHRIRISLVQSNLFQPTWPLGLLSHQLSNCVMIVYFSYPLWTS